MRGTGTSSWRARASNTPPATGALDATAGGAGCADAAPAWSSAAATIAQRSIGKDDSRPHPHGTDGGANGLNWKLELPPEGRGLSARAGSPRHRHRTGCLHLTPNPPTDLVGFGDDARLVHR